MVRHGPIPYGDVPNPYDFANPVSDPELFVGRLAELKEIDYYLDHATRAPRPINLALLGPRASGKTSLLNMIAHGAEQRGFLVVRIDLDEGDANSQLAFFCKLFDCLLTSACDAGAFGGLTGGTYEVFRDMVDAFQVPDDRLFCPFLFPIQYAKAFSVSNHSGQVSDAALKRDLATISKEVQRPIVLIFDECDVLAQSAIHLEKLRNGFMNTPGFLLVFAGTPALFSVMDEVFSPIVRQFKKIPVGPFAERKDTESLIRRPLQKIGIGHPAQVFSRETYQDVSEIHDLSGGRPYEIQLLCHFLFRRMQEGRSSKMQLTLGILEDVMREFEASQDFGARPLINLARKLSPRELAALRILCVSNGFADFDQVWFIHHLFSPDEQWTRDALSEALQAFVDSGLIVVEGTALRFGGDEFDRIYVKYMARERRVPVRINEVPFEFTLRMRLETYLGREIPELRTHSRSFRIRDVDQVQNILDGFADAEKGDPFGTYPGLAEQVYWESYVGGSRNLEAIIVQLDSPWTPVSLIFWNPSFIPLTVANLEGVLDMVRRRATTLGGNVKVEFRSWTTPPVSDLMEAALRAQDSDVPMQLSARHRDAMLDQHVEKHDLNSAIVQGQLAHALHADGGIANDLGYLALVKGDLNSARQWLELATIDDPKREAHMRGLAWYNFALVALLEGDRVEACRRLRVALDLASNEGDSDHAMACMLVPDIERGQTSLQEITKPNLRDTIELATDRVADVCPPEA